MKSLRCIFLLFCVPKAPLQNILISVLCCGYSTKKIRWQWLHDFGFIFPAAIGLGLQMQPIMAAPWLEGKGPQSRKPPILGCRYRYTIQQGSYY